MVTGCCSVESVQLASCIPAIQHCICCFGVYFEHCLIGFANHGSGQAATRYEKCCSAFQAVRIRKAEAHIQAWPDDAIVGLASKLVLCMLTGLPWNTIALSLHEHGRQHCAEYVFSFMDLEGIAELSAVLA